VEPTPPFDELSRQLTAYNLISRSPEWINRIGEASGVMLPRQLLMLLSRIGLASPVELRDVAAGIAADKSTVTRWVLQLAELGLVAKGPLAKDPRRHVLKLTPEGEQAWNQMRDASSQCFAAALSEWPGEDVQSLVRLLTALTESLQESLGIPVADRIAK
jgi:DNA-binding MarR family transcriptional regulator